MQRATYEWLQLLHARHRAREFGKLAQKFLAIAYRRAGFAHVVERGVQGVDLDAADGAVRFTTEVKTTISSAIVFQVKDVDGLNSRRADGYVPTLAVLRLSPLSDWLVVDAEYLAAGRLELDTLRPYRRQDLESFLRPLFGVVVEEHAESTLTGAQAYLDGVLRLEGVVQPIDS